MTQERFPCPCCGHRTLDEPPPGSFECCPVCGWEDDNVQYDDPDYAGGANSVSLNTARANYRAFGAISREAMQGARPPTPEERG